MVRRKMCPGPQALGQICKWESRNSGRIRWQCRCYHEKSSFECCPPLPKPKMSEARCNVGQSSAEAERNTAWSHKCLIFMAEACYHRICLLLAFQAGSDFPGYLAHPDESLNKHERHSSRRTGRIFYSPVADSLWCIWLGPSHVRCWSLH